MIFVEQYPEDTPGYNRLKQNRAAFINIAGQLPDVDSFTHTQTFTLGKGRIIVGSDYQQVLAQTGTASEELKNTMWTSVYPPLESRRASLFCFVSAKTKDIDKWVTLNVPETTAMFFNPMNGEKRQGTKAG